ncbi:very-long-chain 3-oxoacyl-CoA reductase-like [Protopterus annectens]|uniref:very-long-chain 3-oxoacyl-CoA reductase-like n=1 Tax=Protopterus annectens TaxID=7888 RepID=UPI001CFA9764|nr:very-long-chain 3-oxoacyl-CoA reductase-like [Protopterus annectens]
MATDTHCSSQTLFMVTGVLVFVYVLLKLTWTILHGIRVYVLSEIWKVNLHYYGKWAVVTGATGGIGKAYANELAKRGLNVVLISRSLEKLKQVATEIEEKYGGKTKVIQADFTSGGPIYDTIQSSLKDLEIGILVNNVGMTFTEVPSYFLDATELEKRISNLINCNMLSMAQMTRIVLPQMVERKKGVIINISSGAGCFPLPLMAMYSASKAFVDFFSRGLHAEYSSKGIIVQCIIPLLVSTNMTHGIETNAFVKTPEHFASSALNTVGISSRNNGCLAHALQHYFMAFFQELLRLPTLGIIVTQIIHRNMKVLAQQKMMTGPKKEA